jgi:splicing factor 3B subunit 2
LKSKQRERLQPKMNKMDIDYQILHDAFFRHQTKPKMSTIGDVYYEGKEFEVNLKEKAPGELSEELRRALGMPDGAPPPWLILMQQHHGPPPAYPRLKIPGVNCNIPLGAQWGFHPGGWGTAPLDKEGRPRWGWFDDLPPTPDQLAVDKGFRWGMLAPEPEVSDEEEEEEFEQPEEEEEEPAPAPVAPVATVPGIESTVGLEAPAEFELRKVRRDDHPRELYQVLPQQATTVGGATYGSAHTYVVPGAAANKPTAAVDLMKSQKTAAIEVALNPEEVANMSQSELNKKYEQLLKEQEKAKNQALVSKVTDMDVEPKKKDSKKKKDKKEYKF